MGLGEAESIEVAIIGCKRADWRSADDEDVGVNRSAPSDKRACFGRINMGPIFGIIDYFVY